MNVTFDKKLNQFIPISALDKIPDLECLSKHNIFLDPATNKLVKVIEYVDYSDPFPRFVSKPKPVKKLPEPEPVKTPEPARTPAPAKLLDEIRTPFKTPGHFDKSDLATDDEFMDCDESPARPLDSEDEEMDTTPVPGPSPKPAMLKGPEFTARGECRYPVQIPKQNRMIPTFRPEAIPIQPRTLSFGAEHTVYFDKETPLRHETVKDGVVVQSERVDREVVIDELSSDKFEKSERFRQVCMEHTLKKNPLFIPGHSKIEMKLSETPKMQEPKTKTLKEKTYSSSKNTPKMAVTQGLVGTDPTLIPAKPAVRDKERSILRLMNASVLAPQDKAAVSSGLISPWHYASNSRNQERHLNGTTLNWHKDLTTLNSFPAHVKKSESYRNAHVALAQRQTFLKGEFKRLDLDPPCPL